MSDTVLLLVQAGVVACLAGWMIAGVADNWIHPSLNEEAVAMVVRFDRMQEDYPEDYAHVAYRQVTDRRVIRRLFRLIVLWETVAAIGLSLGALALLAAAAGLLAPVVAQTLAAFGALAFTINWAGFLIGGNWFCYWYCHAPGQNTHMQLALWGTGALLLLTQG